MECWIAAVNTLEILYEVDCKSVHFKINKAKLTPQKAQRWLQKFLWGFPGTVPFTTIIIFEEEDRNAQNKSAESWSQKLSDRSTLDNWKQSLTPLL